MTLREIFYSKEIKSYLQAYLENSFYDDFISKRELNRKITKNETLFILELLDDANHKWFVASYLKMVDAFDVEILRKLLEVAIKTSDPSFNSFFITPCLRVFGCIKVIQFLEEFLNDSFENATGILRAIYHVRSLFFSVGKFGDKGEIKWEQVGFWYNWNDEKGYYESYSVDQNGRMTVEEMTQYEPTHEEFIRRKRKLIQDIKKGTKDSALISAADRMLENN